MNTKVGLISLGCAKNLVDSEHMLARLREAGCEIVDDMAEAEVGIVNTCGFIESAKTEAIETILETAQYKQAGTMHGLVVTGCLAQRYRDEIVRDLPEVDVICGTGSYTDIVDAVAAADKREKRAYFGPMDAADLEGDRDRLTPGYTAYFKIAEGCSNTCAYCIIPKLRGKYRSRDYDALLAEARHCRTRASRSSSSLRRTSQSMASTGTASAACPSFCARCARWTSPGFACTTSIPTRSPRN